MFKNILKESIKCLTGLGFITNYEKSSLIPKQTCQFLGFILNVKIAFKKRNDILLRTEDMLITSRLPIRAFARYLGTLTAVCLAVAYGGLYTKSLEQAKYIALRGNDDNDKVMCIPSSLHSDLSW